jgi:hypothetical protein
MLEIVDNPYELVESGHLEPTGDYAKISLSKFSLARGQSTTLVLKCLQLQIFEPTTQIFKVKQGQDDVLTKEFKLVPRY